MATAAGMDLVVIGAYGVSLAWEVGGWLCQDTAARFLFAEEKE